MISLVKLSYIIGLIILILIPLTILLFFKVYERFEVAETAKDEETIHKFMTLLDESYCPAIHHMQEELIHRFGIKGSEDEKTKNVNKLLGLEAGGPIFPCPAPTDPVDIPADIADRIVRTSPYLYKKVDKALRKTKDALNCKKPSKDDEDGFDDISNAPATSDQEPINQEPINQEPINQENPSSKQSKLSKEDREHIIQSRAAALTAVLSNPNIINQVVLVQSMSNELLTIKKLAEENKIRPTCQKDDEDEAGSVNL
jgi:hypothetical protein